MLDDAAGFGRPGIILSKEGAAGRPALFLDRDGVIVEEVAYLGAAKDLRLEAGAAALVRRANAGRIPVVVVTNQSGIGRGLFGWDGYAEVTERMIRELNAEGAAVNAIYACPYHPEGRNEYAAKDHPERKPAPGMLLRAARDLDLDLSTSWIIGDSARDIEAGRAAGIAGGVHVLNGHGAKERPDLRRSSAGYIVHLADDVSAAADMIPILQTPPAHVRSS